MIENLINGNIQDARNQAKRHSLDDIVNYLQQIQDWSWERSYKAARFLKTGKGWQDYCDAK